MLSGPIAGEAALAEDVTGAVVREGQDLAAVREHRRSDSAAAGEVHTIRAVPLDVDGLAAFEVATGRDVGEALQHLEPL